MAQAVAVVVAGKANGAIQSSEASFNRSVSGMKPAVPKWLHVGAVAPEGQGALDGWRQLASETANASVYFLPTCALPGKRTPQQPVIYANWMKTASLPRLRSLAVLQPCDMASSLLPKLPVQLRGRKVLDSTLLGDNSPAALAEFTAAMGGLLQRKQADYILFRDLDISSPIRPTILQAARQRQFFVFEPSAPLPHWWIRFPEKPEEYWSQFSKKTRYNFRYRAKHLDHTVRCLQTPQEVPEFVKRVHSLVARTWQHRRLESLFDVEERLEMWLQFAQAGAFRSYLLEQGDRLVAFAVGMQWRGQFIYDETGYDPADAAKSPGQVLFYRVLEDLISRDTPKLLDFGFGDAEYKRMFANHQTQSGPVALVRKGIVPVSVMMLLRGRSVAGRYARLALGKTGLLSPLRHLYRGHGGAALKQD